MPQQPTFPNLCDAMKKKQTRRELFPADCGCGHALGSPTGAHWPA